MKEAKEKEDWVKKRMSDCEKHYVCKWMSKRLERENGCREMNEEPETKQKEGDKLRAEMEEVIKRANMGDSEVVKTESNILEEKLINVYGDIQQS